MLGRELQDAKKGGVKDHIWDLRAVGNGGLYQRRRAFRNASAFLAPMHVSPKIACVMPSALDPSTARRWHTSDAEHDLGSDERG